MNAAKNATETSTKTIATPTSEQINEHMHLVHRIVAHFMRRLPRSVLREDLVSAGTLGLFYALRTSAANVTSCPDMFAGYAKIRIRGSIVDELRRHDWSPRRRKEKPAVAPAPRASVAPKSNVIPFPVRNTMPPQSSNPAAQPMPVQVVGFDDLPPTMMFADEGRVSPLEECVERAESARLHDALTSLPAREAQIIRMRYFEEIPSKAIAAELGLSEARISQLHARATLRLKAILAASGETGSELDLAA